MEAIGCSKSEAEQVLKAVGGNLQDAYLLHLCTTGKLPAGVPNHPPVDVRHGFRLQVTAPNSTKDRRAEAVSPDVLTMWREIPFAEVTLITEAERRRGNLRADEGEKCVICMCEFERTDEGQVVRLGKCKEHFFHKECISAAVGGAECLKCPVCGVSYGELTGTMPSGTMTTVLDPSLQCQGYPQGSWVITYDFRDGVQDGLHYAGNSRHAVLPDTEDGRDVLRLLICSFYRRHTFRVGNSVTTGATDTVVWSGIHHKTALDGGATNFGFPDESYFQRVREELAARGVVSSSS